MAGNEKEQKKSNIQMGRNRGKREEVSPTASPTGSPPHKRAETEVEKSSTSSMATALAGDVNKAKDALNKPARPLSESMQLKKILSDLDNDYSDKGMQQAITLIATLHPKDLLRNPSIRELSRIAENVDDSQLAVKLIRWEKNPEQAPIANLNKPTDTHQRPRAEEDTSAPPKPKSP